ncbi:MAG: IS66-like element accessory protein TnpA [Bryobacteraceae bacterium]
MDILTDNHQFSRLEVVDTGRRRRWTEGEKLRIVAESLTGPRMASATARRHGISRQLIFTWRRLYREGRLGGVGGFVPATNALELPAHTPAERGRIEIVSANGRRVIVDPDVAVEKLLRIIRGLEALP